MKNNNFLLAVVGMAGSGKSETVAYLKSTYGWPSYYLGQPTFDRLKKLGWEINYKNERIVREQIRREFGMDGYAKLALPRLRQLLKNEPVVIAESLYSWEEYLLFKQALKDRFLVMAVYAPPKVRFQRLNKRFRDRPVKNLREFNERDRSEIEGTNKAGPIAVANALIINDKNLAAFKRSIKTAVKRLQLPEFS